MLHLNVRRYPPHILDMQDTEGFIRVYYEKLTEVGKPSKAYELTEQIFYQHFARNRFAGYDSFRVIRDRQIKARCK